MSIAWKENATFYVGGRKARCIFHTTLPVDNDGRYPIPVVRCGWYKEGGAPVNVSAYTGYLSGMDNSYREAVSLPYSERVVRLIVWEDDYLRVFPEENEFGLIIP